MPWMYPDSPDAYLRLISAIDRKAFAAHFDPVNMICSPHRYFANASFIKECFAKIGGYIKSCHAKDIFLHDRLTVCLEEARPGKGFLDYRVYLRELEKLDIDTPLMLEHLPEASEYQQAAAHIRSVAQQEGLTL
jgi:sugar phosphate isomerase/epimerase